MSLITDKEWFEHHKNSFELKEQFKSYCEWCWWHGSGDCDVCKKIYNKLYIPLRKKELQMKCGSIEAESKGEE